MGEALPGKRHHPRGAQKTTAGGNPQNDNQSQVHCYWDFCSLQWERASDSLSSLVHLVKLVEWTTLYFGVHLLKGSPYFGVHFVSDSFWSGLHLFSSSPCLDVHLFIPVDLLGLSEDLAILLYFLLYELNYFVFN